MCFNKPFWIWIWILTIYDLFCLCCQWNCTHLWCFERIHDSQNQLEIDKSTSIPNWNSIEIVVIIYYLIHWVGIIMTYNGNENINKCHGIVRNPSTTTHSPGPISDLGLDSSPCWYQYNNYCFAMSSAIRKHDKPIISTPIYMMNNRYPVGDSQRRWAL